MTDREVIQRALFLILAAEHTADWPAYSAGADAARDVLRAALAQQAEPVAWPLRTVMVLCPVCGNKRCPRAASPTNACTNSNEPGQPGSNYPAPPTEPGAA